MRKKEFVAALPTELDAVAKIVGKNHGLKVQQVEDKLVEKMLLDRFLKAITIRSADDKLLLPGDTCFVVELPKPGRPVSINGPHVVDGFKITWDGGPASGSAYYMRDCNLYAHSSVTHSTKESAQSFVADKRRVKELVKQHGGP